MGKINEYQRKNLASVAVGTAPEDKSGQVIGGTITRVGGAIAKREAIVQDQYATAQANVAVMQFGLGFQKMAVQAKKEMAGNPKGYPSKIFTSGSVMVETYANGIQDDDVRSKFVSAANVILKAGVFAAGDWAAIKFKENAVIATIDAITLGNITAGDTVTIEGLDKSLETVIDMAYDESPEDALSTVEIETLFKKQLPNTFATHFSNRIVDDPAALIKDIDAGKYDKYAAEDKASRRPAVLTSKMIDSARTSAVSRIQADKTLMRELERDNYSAATEEALRGNIDFIGIDALVNAKNPEDRISPAQATTLKTGLVNKIAADATKIIASEPDAASYIRTVYNSFDDKIDRAIVTNQIIKAFSDGVITAEEGRFLNQMRTQLKDIQAAKISNGWKRGAQQIKNAVESAWTGGFMRTSKEATAVRNMLGKVATGVDPETAAQQEVKNIQNNKVLEDNPNLATAEDPLEAAYGLVAVDMMNRGGVPVADANTKALIQTLKANADRQRKPKEE